MSTVVHLLVTDKGEYEIGSGIRFFLPSENFKKYISFTNYEITNDIKEYHNLLSILVAMKQKGLKSSVSGKIKEFRK